MRTNVMIQDGELLILGGLIEDKTDGSASKVPILGDIPLLGRLFRSSRKIGEQRVLMMFIRPTIIRTPEDAKKLSQKKFDHLIYRDLKGKRRGPLTEQLEAFKDNVDSDTDE
jgi:general secretion pathway protein D